MNLTEYKKRCFSLMTKGELVIELLHKVIIHIKRAQIAIESNDFETTNRSLVDAQLILAELHHAMRRNDAQTKQAAEIFNVLAQVLKAANINHDQKLLEEVLDFITELHATYAFELKQKR